MLRDRHTCLNALEWRGQPVGAAITGTGIVGGIPGMGGVVGGMQGNNGMGGVNGGMGQMHTPGLEIRQDEDGNIVGGARVLGPMPPRPSEAQQHDPNAIVPVLPKVQRNSASRLPFLMEILPRLMNITKETSPTEIRECLLREYGAEVHLQQCRRAKTEILKKRATEQGTEGQSSGMENNGQGQGQGNQSLDGMGGSESAGDGNTTLFGSELNQGTNGLNGVNGEGPHAQGFELHTASGVVIPQVPSRREAALNAVGEQPVRCPYCVNHRWLNSIKDAVEHMSMHVVV